MFRMGRRYYPSLSVSSKRGKRFEREFAADDREMSANHATFASHALCIRR